MEKTKRQLRAEAVERLESSDPETTADFIRILLDGLKAISPGKVRAALIELLSDDELPDGDALGDLRDWISRHDPALRGKGLASLETIANMVERDYVRRDYANDTIRGLSYRYDHVKEDIAKLETERDAWMAMCNKTSEDVIRDSREKLEYDIREFAEWSWTKNALVDRIMLFIDRQAAITEREYGERMASAAMCSNVCAVVGEQRRRIDELTADLDTAHAKNRSLRAHISKMQEGRHGWHVKYGKLAEQLRESNRERERLRKQLGIALDHAHGCSYCAVTVWAARQDDLPLEGSGNEAR